MWVWLCALLCCFARPAAALPFIFFQADHRVVEPGDNLNVDVLIGGLRSGGTNALLGGFQVGLHFDPRLGLLPSSLMFGDGLGDVALGDAIAGSDMTNIEDGVIGTFSISLLEGSADSCVFCTGSYLEDLQADSFRLATIGFRFPYRPGPGRDLLIFDAPDVVLTDANGILLPAGPAHVLAVPVPEPPAWALLPLGLALLAWTRRRSRTPAWALAALLLCGNASAQSYDIPLRGATIHLTAGTFDFGDMARAADTARYAVVQFDHSPDARQLAAVKAIGVQPVSFLYNNAWICRITRTPTSDDLYRFGIRAGTRWLPEHKLSTALRSGRVPAWALLPGGEVRLVVRFFKDTDPTRTGAMLVGSTSHAEQTPGDAWQWQVSSSLSSIRALANIPAIETISEVAPRTPTNDTVRAALRVDDVQQADLSATPPRYNGLSGAGIRIAVGEDAESTHPDFINHDSAGRPVGARFANTLGYSGSEHGTHVAGTIGGNGWNSDKAGNGGRPYQWRGMAPESTLVNGGLGDGYAFGPVDVSNQRPRRATTTTRSHQPTCARPRAHATTATTSSRLPCRPRPPVRGRCWWKDIGCRI